MAEEFLSIVIIFVVGYLSATLTLKINIPLARLIGPIVAIGLLKVLGFSIIAPYYLKAVVSIILGGFFGYLFDKKVIKEMKVLIKPCLFLIVANILITVFYGYLLTASTFIDKPTALFAVVPGGIAEMSIIALSYHADLVQVTSFQMARLLAVVLLVPPIIIKLFAPKEKNKEEEITTTGTSMSFSSKVKGNKHWSIIFGIGAVGGTIFYFMGIPASFLIGSLLAVLIYNIFKKESVVISSPPRKLNDMAQIGMGGIIGVSFTQDSLGSIGELFLPILITTFLIIMGSTLIAWLISKIFKLDFLTSLMASIPGGLLPMILMAEELEADVTIVSTLQTVRLMTAVLIIPLVYGFII